MMKHRPTIGKSEEVTKIIRRLELLRTQYQRLTLNKQDIDTIFNESLEIIGDLSQWRSSVLVQLKNEKVGK